MTDKLMLPPFGKILLAYQEQKVRLTYPIYIHIGTNAKDHAFNDIRSGAMASFLPPGANIMQYRWPIEGQHVILMDNGGMTVIDLKKIMFHLKSFNPRIIYLWSQEHPSVYSKGETHE